MDASEIERWNLASRLLDRVLELPRGEQRAAAAALGREHGVSREMAQLLAGSHGSSLLDETLDDVLRQMPAAVPEPNALRGQVLGNWKLGDEIGRGGMSVVYHARRTGQDFEQHAALKVLSVAHLGEDFVASFLRERQILSDLQHPGIARLIDGGLTPEGAPFLVMQYVDGQRIDHWCRDNDAGLRTIAELMLELCQAVAYAQRRLVVHQDINPVNVLVDEHGRPVLIDFGIARLLEGATAGGGLQAFTPRYAAPEQERGGAITTATDVFALGKLFRELARDRRPDSDLELVLRVATQADPEQRYPNARALATDLQAWLEKRPVQARPSTPAYRARRFIDRNRWGVAAALLLTLSVLAGLGGALWQARIAAGERDVARAESKRATEVTEFLKDLFRASDPDRAQGEEVTARELLDQGGHQLRYAFNRAPDTKAEMLVLLGGLYRELGELDAAGPLLQEGLALADAARDPMLRVEGLRALALLEMESGDHESALQRLDQAVSILAQEDVIPGTRHAALMNPLLFSLAETGRIDQAVERGYAALGKARRAADLPPAALYDYLYSLANVLTIAERIDEAEPLLLEAAAMDTDSIASPSNQIALHSSLAGILYRKGDPEGALEQERLSLSLAEKIYPPGHLMRARKLNNLSTSLIRLGRYRESETALAEALNIYRKAYGDTPHPRIAAAYNNLGRALQDAGQFAAAEPYLVRALELARELFGVDDPRYVVATGNLGTLYRQLGQYDRADNLLTESLQRRRDLLGPDHRAVGGGLALLAALRLDQGRPAEALDLASGALDLYQRIGFENAGFLLAAGTRRARALADLGRFEEADAAFAEFARLGEAVGGDAGSVWPEFMAARVEYLVERQDPAADAELQRALRACRDTFGDEHPTTQRVVALLDARQDARGSLQSETPVETAAAGEIESVH